MGVCATTGLCACVWECTWVEMHTVFACVHTCTDVRATVAEGSEAGLAQVNRRSGRRTACGLGFWNKGPGYVWLRIFIAGALGVWVPLCVTGREVSVTLVCVRSLLALNVGHWPCADNLSREWVFVPVWVLIAPTGDEGYLTVSCRPWPPPLELAAPSGHST